MPTNVGTANYATYDGVPETTVTWTGRSGTSRAGTLFNQIEKEALTDTSETKDNDGEIQAIRDRNDRMQFRMVIKPIGASAAAAAAILGDLPKKHSIVTITSEATDTDISASGTILVESASVIYSPEGDGLVNMTAIKHYGKTLVALS